MILPAVSPIRIRWSGKLHGGRRHLWKRLRAQAADQCSKIFIALTRISTRNHMLPRHLTSSNAAVRNQQLAFRLIATISANPSNGPQICRAASIPSRRRVKAPEPVSIHGEVFAQLLKSIIAVVDNDSSTEETVTYRTEFRGHSSTT
jgi:hypothetical protein